VLETGALAGFLPGLCEHLLGQPLAMPGVATWWCGEPPAMEDALAKADHLVFKSAVPYQMGRRFNPVFGEDLDEDELARLTARDIGRAWRKLRGAPRGPALATPFPVVQPLALPMVQGATGRALNRALIGHKVRAIVNYDRFSIVPELIDDYIAMVKAVVERHYHDVTRYTSSTFLRMKLGEALAKRQIVPKISETEAEAKEQLAKP
jgi:hypothetical protein